MKRSPILRAATLLLTLSAFACSGESTASPDEAGLDRETFIATYVDLRTAVIRDESHELSDQEREGCQRRRADRSGLPEVHGTHRTFPGMKRGDGGRIVGLRCATPH